MESDNGMSKRVSKKDLIEVLYKMIDLVNDDQLNGIFFYVSKSNNVRVGTLSYGYTADILESILGLIDVVKQLDPEDQMEIFSVISEEIPKIKSNLVIV